MSKNHRHYVHLRTVAMITHFCFLAQWILGSQAPACNKSICPQHISKHILQVTTANL